jgi:arylsulfatase A-like enzyme
MHIKILFVIGSSLLGFMSWITLLKNERPNIILIMSDDQGWGQIGYYHHPILKTPHLVKMAEEGLRMDRFYAAAPVCSPTRSSVLTGRTNERSAVFAHGFPMRRQEKTIAQALQKAGYATAHFGKWHLNGLKGPGVPILSSDQRNPGIFGFDDWLSVSNFFDLNPLMSHNGSIREFSGSSSDIIVNQAIQFIRSHKNNPFFVVIWFGSPHEPWRALPMDKNDLKEELEETKRNYLGEIVEMDNSIGRLHTSLEELGLTENTLIWFNSDNGSVSLGGKEGAGGLRDFKGSLYEGGIRVPCIIKWPAKIKKGKISLFPASTMDIFPTIANICNLPDDVLLKPTDGMSIDALFYQLNDKERIHPIPFKYRNQGALIDNDFKLVTQNIENKEYALFHLKRDRAETIDVISLYPKKAGEMISFYEKWLASVNRSLRGEDYENGLQETDPVPLFWWQIPDYAPYLSEWKNRPEFSRQLTEAFPKE